jgi:hypothetical protein
LSHFVDFWCQFSIRESIKEETAMNVPTRACNDSRRSLDDDARSSSHVDRFFSPHHASATPVTPSLTTLLSDSLRYLQEQNAACPVGIGSAVGTDRPSTDATVCLDSDDRFGWNRNPGRGMTRSELIQILDEAIRVAEEGYDE